MPKLFDRVKVNTPTTGTGDVTFGAASSDAFFTPTEAGAVDGDVARYVIVDGTDFEEGTGTIGDTVSTMTRTVTRSKIGGVVGTSKINLSGTAVLTFTAAGADILNPAANLADLADADEALDNLGASESGKTVLTGTPEQAKEALEIEPGIPDVDRRNIRLDRIYQSKLLASVRRVENEMATGLKGATEAVVGIDGGNSDNVDTSHLSADGYVSATLSGGADQIPTMTGATTSGVTMSASTQTAGEEAWKAGDKSGSTDWGTASGNATGWLKIDLGSAKTIAVYTLTPAPVGGSGAAYMPRTWTLQGSATGSFSGEQTTLDTRSGISFSGTTSQNFTVATPGSFRYYRLNVTQNNGGSGFLIIGEINLLAAVVDDMTLVTVAQTTDASVSSARVLLEYDASDSPTLNADLTAEVTCDGGANWTEATLTLATENSQDGRSVAETALTTCTTGTSVAARIKIANGKDVKVYGLALSWE